MISAFFIFFVAFVPLVSTPSFAQEFSDYTFLNEPTISWKFAPDEAPVDLPKVCAEMKYNYADEKVRLSEIQQKLSDLAVQPLTDDIVHQIDQLKAEAHERTDHLIFLARPEWNRDSVFMALTWWMPKYFDEKMMNATASTVLLSRYKNEVYGDAISNFYISGGNLPGSQKCDSYANCASEYRQSFRYVMKASYLQACQTLSTIEFDVVIDYEILFNRPVPVWGSQKEHPGGVQHFLLRGKNP